VIIKVCNIFKNKWLFIDPYIKFDDLVLMSWNVHENFTNKNLLMSWAINLSGEEVNYLVIELFCFKYFTNQ
jgi:hypothetical protein